MDNKPKCLSLKSDEGTVIVYTDGSYESNNGSEVAMIGGVFLDGLHDARVFGCNVPEGLLDRWHADGKEHLIGQVEMYAIAVARMLWKERLHHRRTILFVDNWPVLDTFIPGSAKQSSWREILLTIEKIDGEFPSHIWAARVPSESNVADPPSRGTIEPIKFLGKIIVDSASCPMTNVQLVSCLN